MSSSSNPTVTLNNGAAMPLVGLGTWKSTDGKVAEAVRVAIDAGYRHIDGAMIYGNEAEIGEALRDKIGSAVTREELFITSKLWNTFHAKGDVVRACRKTLEDLAIDYLDMFLIHWPVAFPTVESYERANLFPTDTEGNPVYENVALTDTWEGMEELVDLGLVRAIGVSNFNKRQLELVLQSAKKYKPAVNQIESHPYLPQHQLIEVCREHSVVVTAYSPLGSPDRPWAKAGDPSLLDDPRLTGVASKHGKTVAQVLIRFQVQRGVVVIPKSVTPSRIVANFEVFDFELDAEDLAALAEFEMEGGAGRLCGNEKWGAHPEYPFHEAF